MSPKIVRRLDGRIPFGKGQALRHEAVGSQNQKADRMVISGIGGDLIKLWLACGAVIISRLNLCTTMVSAPNLVFGTGAVMLGSPGSGNLPMTRPRIAVTA